MALAKLHPCFGWLHLSGDHYRICFNKSIQMRDEQMKAGTYDYGLPEGYESWAFENLKELVKIPIYKKLIEEYLSQLDLSISNREKELNQTYLSQELVKMKNRKELIDYHL